MKTVTLFFALIITYTGFSQKDSLDSKSGLSSYSFAEGQLITIKGEDIRRFPSSNIMEVLNGYFPWVFGYYPDANDYLFVIDGFLSRDISSVNLDDLEEISYSYTNMNGMLAPFSKPGIFYVKTKGAGKDKIRVNFNTRGDLSWSSAGYALNQNISINPFTAVIHKTHDNKLGFLNSNHLSVAVSGKKWELVTSGRINFQKLPEMNKTFTADSAGSPNYFKIQSQTSSRGRDNNLSIKFNYNFSNKLKAGFVSAYSHYGLNQDTLVVRDFNTSRSRIANDRLANSDYYYLAAYLNWSPLNKFYHDMKIEYNAGNFLGNGNGNNVSVLQSYLSEIVSINTERTSVSGFTISSLSRYNFISRKNIKASFSISANWTHPYAEFTRYYRSELLGSYPNYNESRYWGKGDGQYATVNPSVSFSYKNYFRLSGGYAYLIGKKAFEKIVKKERMNYYADAEFDIMNLAAPKTAKRFGVSVSAHYSDMVKNTSKWPFFTSSQLKYISAYSFPIGYYPKNNNIYYFGDNEVGLFRNKLLTVGLNLSEKKHNITGGFSWTSLNRNRVEVVRMSFGGSYIDINVLVDEKISAVAAYISARVIDKKQFKWDVYANVLLPRKTEKWKGYVQSPINPWIGKQIGIQNKIMYRNYWLQCNALLELDHEYRKDNLNYNPYNIIIIKTNQFAITNFLAGYNFSKKPGKAKDVTVFIQGRNLLLSDRMVDIYNFYSFAGAGVNLTF